MGWRKRCPLELHLTEKRDEGLNKAENEIFLFCLCGRGVWGATELVIHAMAGQDELGALVG